VNAHVDRIVCIHTPPIVKEEVKKFAKNSFEENASVVRIATTVTPKSFLPLFSVKQNIHEEPSPNT